LEGEEKMEKIEIDMGTVKDLQNSYGGVCLNCGAFQWDGCEPDAENYFCEECENNAVWGIDQAILIGKVNIK
jgi:hypothetical protein